MTRYIGFGHSHIVAIAKGAYALQAEGATCAGVPLEGAFHYLYDAPFHPAWIEPGLGENEGLINPTIVEELHRVAPRFVILSIGGNEHNVLSFAAQDRPFDFVAGDAPDAPLDASAEIVPESAIRETFLSWMKDKIAILRALRQASAAPCLLIGPPPALPRAHVAANSGELVQRGVDPSHIATDQLRAKMWRLQTDIYKKICAAADIAFIPTPAEFIDAEGMLAAKARSGDATHANLFFGAAVMRDALRIAETKLT